jgi:hypothetical protein
MTEVGLQCLIKNLHYLNMALTFDQEHPKILVQQANSILYTSLRA